MNPNQGVLREQSHFLHFMDIAIVTGAETPLGLRLIEDLIRQGCRVHGIGNNFSNVTFADRHFIAHAIDLSDLEAVARTAEAILEKEKAIHILIHAIDVTPGAAFEHLPIGNLEAILKVGLLGPVMLTRMALPNLLRFRGQLINIIPANKSGHIASAVNALIEGGLREMNTALFDQARDSGLRVTNLILRQNTVTDDETYADKHLQTRIDPDHVARTVERLLDPNEPNVPNEITLYPRLSGAAEEMLPETALPIDPYTAVVLPPKEYFPPKQKAITTREPDQIERTIPYTDEEMEEKIASAIEDYESHPERYEEPKKNKKNKRTEREPKHARAEPAAQSTDSNTTDSEQGTEQDDERSDQSKSRRGRRRGGRNRNRNRDQQDEKASPATENSQDSRSENKESAVADKNPHSNTKKANQPDKSPRLRRNRDQQDEKSSPATENSQVSRSENKESAVADKNPHSNTKKANQPDKSPRLGRNRSRKPVVRPEEKYAAYERPSVPAREYAQPISEQPKQDSFQPREVSIEVPKPKKDQRAAKPKKATATKSQQPELTPEAPIVKKKATKKAAKKVAAKKVPAKKAAKKLATKKVAKKAATKKAVKKAAKKAVKKTIEKVKAAE
ncbi:MAG: NAD(P)-dependent dehydrogenase (short-subunit alcohol dehydrogenase family) [Lentimonas sp.]|jgi:NAD(P)-dependent dehydrogenase (short-subunit alcohol dehydrogenase family)